MIYKIVKENNKHILRESDKDVGGYELPNEINNKFLIDLASNVFSDGYNERKKIVAKAMRILNGDE